MSLTSTQTQGLCRWGLKRRWKTEGPTLGWIMLNPSTADDLADDPTIRRIIGFTKRAGYTGLQVENLTPVRCTNPDHLIDYEEAITDEKIIVRNHARIIAMRKRMDIVLAWGSRLEQTKRWSRIHQAMSRARDAALLNDPHSPYKSLYLAKTKSGQPRHPLMIPNAQSLMVWVE